MRSCGAASVPAAGGSLQMCRRWSSGPPTPTGGGGRASRQAHREGRAGWPQGPVAARCWDHCWDRTSLRGPSGGWDHCWDRTSLRGPSGGGDGGDAARRGCRQSSGACDATASHSGGARRMTCCAQRVTTSSTSFAGVRYLLTTVVTANGDCEQYSGRWFFVNGFLRPKY